MAIDDKDEVERIKHEIVGKYLLEGVELKTDVKHIKYFYLAISEIFGALTEDVISNKAKDTDSDKIEMLEEYLTALKNDIINHWKENNG